ncbi:MAG: hypothetical protein MMC33_000795 [Icmadophila ericetorum]|nr:hypothetical protein [Icmadophila ericetorum]
MGWDNWNAFGCSVSEELLLGTAQKMVDYGLRDLGYQYVILDDCWSAGRSESGTLMANTTKFPNGMAHVAAQLHGMGLKFGMYSDAGMYTCGGYQGSLGRETQDAKTFADWGIDYLKYDNCYNEGQSGTSLITYNRYNAMSKALNATGRPVVYSMCNWGEDKPWNWAQTMANSWRMSGDIYDSFDRPDVRCPCTGDEGYECQLPGFQCSMMNILNKMAAIQSKSQSGAVNDMDMLEVGNGGMSDDEYKVHFSMWAFMVSPLIMGTDVGSMSHSTLSIYSNPAVIALSQDPSISAGNRIWRQSVPDKDSYGQGEISLWVRTLANGDQAVTLVNGGNNSRMMHATLADIFFDEGADESPQAAINWDIYDLWANRMSNATATEILNNTALYDGPVTASMNSTTRYNATAMSYAEGLALNSTALFGAKIGSVQAMGTLKVMVPRHGVGLYRLRSTGVGIRERDEL